MFTELSICSVFIQFSGFESNIREKGESIHLLLTARNLAVFEELVQY